MLAIRRTSRAGMSGSRPPWMSEQRHVLHERQDAARLGLPWIGAQSLGDRLEAALGHVRPEDLADPSTRRAGQPWRHGIRDDRHDAWPRGDVDALGGVRVAVGGDQATIAQHGQRRQRHDAAHRRAHERDARHTALPEPGEGARDVLDLRDTERRRPASDSPCPRKSSPSTRAVRRRNGAYSTRSGASSPYSRAGGGSPRADRRPSPRRRVPSPEASAVSQRAASRPPSRDRKRTTSPPSRSRAGPSEASSGVRRGASRNPVGDAPAEARAETRDRDAQREQERPHHRPPTPVGAVSASRTSELHVSIVAWTSRTRAVGSKDPLSLSTSRIATGRPAASAR